METFMIKSMYLIIWNYIRSILSVHVQSKAGEFTQRELK